MAIIIPDVIEDFILGLDLSAEVLSFSDDGTDTTITVDNVFHLRAAMTVSINAVDYTVLSVDYDTDTVIVSGVIPAPVTFIVPTPFYFHGTPYATNAHLSRIKPDANKTPFIYLYEIVRERVQPEDSRIYSFADLRLFFLDVANYQDWDTDQHYSNVIRPQLNLVNAFIAQARKSSFFGEIPEYTQIAHVKFGVYVDNKGHVNSLFNERLSGIEIRADIPLINCNC